MQLLIWVESHRVLLGIRDVERADDWETDALLKYGREVIFYPNYREIFFYQLLYGSGWARS